jgi:hypothetical protein
VEFKFIKNKRKIIKAFQSNSITNKIRIKEYKFKLVVEALVKFLQ